MPDDWTVDYPEIIEAYLGGETPSLEGDPEEVVASLLRKYGYPSSTNRAVWEGVISRAPSLAFLDVLTRYFQHTGTMWNYPDIWRSLESQKSIFKEKTAYGESLLEPYKTVISQAKSLAELAQLLAEIKKSKEKFTPSDYAELEKAIALQEFKVGQAATAQTAEDKAIAEKMSAFLASLGPEYGGAPAVNPMRAEIEDRINAAKTVNDLIPILEAKRDAFKAGQITSADYSYLTSLVGSWTGTHEITAPASGAGGGVAPTDSSLRAKFEDQINTASTRAALSEVSKNLSNAFTTGQITSADYSYLMSLIEGRQTSSGAVVPSVTKPFEYTFQYTEEQLGEILTYAGAVPNIPLNEKYAWVWNGTEWEISLVRPGMTQYEEQQIALQTAKQAAEAAQRTAEEAWAKKQFEELSAYQKAQQAEQEAERLALAEYQKAQLAEQEAERLALAEYQKAQLAEQERARQLDWMQIVTEWGGQPRQWIPYWQATSGGVTPEQWGQPGMPTPPTPSWLAQLSALQTGQPITPTSVKIPGPQTWGQMAPSAQQGLMGYLGWTGLPEQDWLQKMEKSFGGTFPAGQAPAFSWGVSR